MAAEGGWGHSGETTGGQNSEKAEPQLVNLLQAEVGGCVLVKTASAKTNTSSSPESIEIDARPRLCISKDEKSKILSPYSPDRDQIQ